MNEIKVFENAEFGQIRTVALGNEPWFVAADVCRALEIDRTQSRRLEEDEKGVYSIQTPGGEQEVTIVNEAGLYMLVLGSRKPEARAFKRWITHEVIPSIRKHGAYATEAVIDNILADPDFGIRLLCELKAERVRAQDLEVANARLTVDKQIMAPRGVAFDFQIERRRSASKPTWKPSRFPTLAEYFDELVDRNLLTSLRDTSKELAVREKEFVRWLLDQKYLYRDKKGKLTPCAGKGDGLFEVKECYNEKTAWSGVQTMVTPKGRETFRLLTKGL